MVQLLPTIGHLTERQYQLFFLFHSVIARFKPTGLARLVDSDLADAAAAVAATLETSTRGVIYEHAPTGLPAQALAAELKATLARIREQGATVFDHEAAVVLRAIEKGSRELGGAPGRPGAKVGYLDLVARLLRTNRALEPDTATVPERTLIVP